MTACSGHHAGNQWLLHAKTSIHQHINYIF